MKGMAVIQVCISIVHPPGADSPDAVHKLLQLTDRVRPLENRKQRHHVLSTVTMGGPSQTLKPVVSGNQATATLSTSSSMLHLSPESSSVLGPNQAMGPEHRRPPSTVKGKKKSLTNR